MVLAFNTNIRNAQGNAITSEVGANAILRIYSGTRPASGGTATTLLAQLTCNATFAPAASGGVVTLNSVTQDSGADNTGTATWFRILKSDGTTWCVDGSAGESGTDLILDDADIVAGGAVSMTTPRTITIGNA